MKRNKQIVFLTVMLITVTLAFTSCTGGGKISEEQQIEKFLQQVASAIKSLDPNRIANLFAYPIKVDMHDEIREIDKEYMHSLWVVITEELKAFGITITEYQFRLSEAEIVVTGNGKEAIVYDAKAFIQGAVDGVKQEPEFVDLEPFKLVKRDGKWKLSSDAGFI